jgi:hypothetical protein
MAGDRFTEAFVRQGIELATVATGTVAIGELSCRHGPFHRHVFLAPGRAIGLLASRAETSCNLLGWRPVIEGAAG